MTTPRRSADMTSRRQSEAAETDLHVVVEAIKAPRDPGTPPKRSVRFPAQSPPYLRAGARAWSSGATNE